MVRLRPSPPCGLPLTLPKKKADVTPALFDSCAAAAWKIVKSWLGPEAISKLKFASKSEVQNFVNLEYLPPHLGGTVGRWAFQGVCVICTESRKCYSLATRLGSLPRFPLRGWIIAGRKLASRQQKRLFRAALVCSHYHALAERLPSSEPTLLQPSPFIWPPSQDPFKYSYPPLPDDDFQTPICDNGPIVSEDEVESKDGESEVKDALESSFSSEVAVKPKKVRFSFRIITGP